METAVLKNGEAENGVPQEQPQAPQPAPAVPQLWQWLLAGVAVLSAFVMALMRQLAINRWRRKN
jgi:hypothetical protein